MKTVMREIFYRGKKIDGGEWIEGNYIFEDFDRVGIHQIGTIIQCFVIPETLGQFTGLTDKNGVKIFEGDIVRRFNGRGQEVMRYAVKWNTDCCMFVLMSEYTYLGEYDSDFTVFYGEDLEVIGNIYDGGFEFD